MPISGDATTSTNEEQVELRARLDEAAAIERDLFFLLVKHVPHNNERGRHVALLALRGLYGRVVAEMPEEHQQAAIEACADTLRLSVDEFNAFKRGRLAGGQTIARH